MWLRRLPTKSACSLVLLLAATRAHGDPVLLKGGSPYPSSEIVAFFESGGKWTIDLRPVGSPGTTVTIQADGTTEAIGRITIRPVSDTGSSTNTNLFVRELNGGTISGIDSD